MSKGKPFEDLSKALWYIQQESELARGAYIIPYHAPWWMSYEEQDKLINQLASINFVDMKDFWEALSNRKLDAMRTAIQARAEQLAGDYPTHVILTRETMPDTPPEPQPTRLVNTMSQGHRLRELRKRRNMTRAQTVTHMRARGFPWTDNTIGNLEAGNRRISLNEAIALMETYGYIGANMFPAINYILTKTM